MSELLVDVKNLQVDFKTEEGNSTELLRCEDTCYTSKYEESNNYC